MRKILAAASLAVLALAKHHHHQVEARPELNLYTTFKSDVSLHTWDGTTLKPYKGITATAKVDGDRNKVKVDAKVQVPIFGKVSAEVLFDMNDGSVKEYIPMLKLCQKQTIPLTGSLKALLEKVYSEQGGISIYDGEAQPAWEAVTYHKFHGSLKADLIEASVTAFVDKTTLNGRWLQESSNVAGDPKVVISVPKGEEQATFTDADFSISGCNSYETDPKKFVSIWH